jgi:excisionase family DNA binding protein
MTDDASPGYGSLEQVAAHLGVSRQTVCRMLARGELESVKIGRARRIPWAAVEAWFKEAAQSAGAAGPGGAA